MKKYVLFLLLVSQWCFGQNPKLFSEYEAKYVVNWLRDTADVNTWREEVVSLLIGDKVSLFKSTQKAIADSIAMVEAEKSYQNPVDGKVIFDFSKVPEAKFVQEVFTTESSMIVYNEIMSSGYEYETSVKIDWKILDERKVINNYSCRKATGVYNNRVYIAWFTEDIPFSEGPYIFKGLPGLLVELYDTKKYYLFRLGGFNKVRKPIVPTNALRTTYEKFVKARNNFLADPSGTVASQVSPKIASQILKKESRERIDKLHRSNNNFLD